MDATIKIFKRYRKVTFYSIVLEGKGNSEYSDFLSKFIDDEENLPELRQLVSFIYEMGERKGAIKKFFKNEDYAFRFSVPGYIETHNPLNFGFRLYCLPINENIVILFNGCMKTNQKATQCQNCSSHFRTANRLSQKINEAINQGFIQINESEDGLIIDENFTLFI
ncbi:MAG: hypothetical protein JWQ09_5080 [Segetibacter sp.]|nr:hypothetical protein [Segetibacter sp.]